MQSQSGKKQPSPPILRLENIFGARSLSTLLLLPQDFLFILQPWPKEADEPHRQEPRREHLPGCWPLWHTHCSAAYVARLFVSSPSRCCVCGLAPPRCASHPPACCCSCARGFAVPPMQPSAAAAAASRAPLLPQICCARLVVRNCSFRMIFQNVDGPHREIPPSPQETRQMLCIAMLHANLPEMH